MGGNFQMAQAAPTSITTPSSSYYAFFIADGSSGTTAGTLYKKDSSGTVTAAAATTGVTASSNDNGIVVGGTSSAVTLGWKLPWLGNVVGANKTYVASDRNSSYSRSNSGSAMADNLPSGLGSSDIGFFIQIYNEDSVGALVLTGVSGNFRGSNATLSATFTLQPLCRQAFVWSGTQWTSFAGNANLMKVPTSGIVAGALPTFTDGVGRQMAVATSAQVSAAGAAATTSLQGMQSAVDKSKSDNWFDKAIYNVLDHGISPSNSGATNSTAWSALMTAIVDNGTVYFPPSTSAYQFASTCAIPSGKHLTLRGEGPQKSIVQTTSATADIFTCGDWYQTFRGLKFTSSVTRTAGAAINSGNNVAVCVYECDFSGMWDGIVYTGGSSAGNLGIVDKCSFAATLSRGIVMDGANANAYINNVTMDGTLGVQVAGIEINQCGSLLISNSDLIRAVNNLKLNPTSPNGVFSVYCTNTFFDTSSASSVKFMGTGNIQRVKFVNCWFSSSVIGCEFASTATTLPTAIDFVNCDIFANSGRGIYANGVQDFACNNCRISANTTAGIEAVASTGSVTKFNLQNNTIGPTAGFGGNGQGVLVNAGTYGGYNITGNFVAGNTSNLNITDSGSVATADLKIIQDNLGHKIGGGIATIGANVATTTTNAIVLQGRVPANGVGVGSTFRIKVLGVVTTASTAQSVTVRLGATGVIGTDTLAWTSAAITGTINTVQILEFLVTVRTIGSSGTAVVEGLVTNSVTGVSRAAGVATVVTINTQNPWFMEVANSATTGAFSWSNGVVEAL